MRIFILCLVLPFCGFSQDSTLIPEKPKPEVGSGFMAIHMALPSVEMQRAIKNRMGNNVFGLSLQGLLNLFTSGKKNRTSAIMLGGELGYTYYGRFIQDITVNDYKGDSNFKSRIACTASFLGVYYAFCRRFCGR